MEVAAVRKQAHLDRKAIQKQAKEAVLATLTAKIVEAVNAEKLRHAAEKLALEGQLADMQRKLQSRRRTSLASRRKSICSPRSKRHSRTTMCHAW